MAAEFHGLNLTCSPNSVIPSGPDYTNVQFQACAYAGSKPGNLILNGDDYLAAKFNFFYGNVWRNFGILILFTVGFVAISSWLSETIEWDTGSAGPIQYKKRRQRFFQSASKGADEEKNAVQVDHQATPIDRDGALNPSNRAAPELVNTQSVFTWENLRYSVQNGNDERLLLNDVSGYCKPGQMTALVGSSGAGKSTCKSVHAHIFPVRSLIFNFLTVMTILTRRQRTGKLSGDILVDGNPTDSSTYRKIGYCQQMDVHDETSTIREAFEFSALLRQSSLTPEDDKLAYVDTVLEILELIAIQDAVIGSLQLEQKKRVTIGVELCAKPELLMFLDEPTSVSHRHLSWASSISINRIVSIGPR
jgi:ATP-binding cassette subfamily G (WHITE) protein 2 (SNQ2)